MKLNLKAIARSMGMALQKHSPEILTGIGIAGMVTTTILAVRATPKALLLIQEAEEVKHQNTDASALTPVETIKAAWLCYVPAAVTGVLSMTCLIGASSVNLRRNAALATAYTLSESALKEYREKVVETIGEKKEQAVQDAVAKERISKSPVTNQEVIITEKGNTLCYDVISGRYFKSDIEKLKRAANDLSRRMLDEGYISLNDFYYEIALPETKLGDELGWHIDNGLVDLRFSSQLAEDGTPCLVIDYQIAPKYDYGIAYTDGTERITQLNRSVENNLMKQIEFLTSMLYSQLGITQSVMDGTADEKTMLNYNNRTIEPIVSAIVDEMKRKFLTKTARSQSQSIMFFTDPFRLVPVDNIAEIADKFTRNEIMTSNEFRQIIGMKPSDDPRADELRNKNLSEPGGEKTEQIKSQEENQNGEI